MVAKEKKNILEEDPSKKETTIRTMRSDIERYSPGSVPQKGGGFFSRIFSKKQKREEFRKPEELIQEEKEKKLKSEEEEKQKKQAEQRLIGAQKKLREAEEESRKREDLLVEERKKQEQEQKMGGFKIEKKTMEEAMELKEEKITRINKAEELKRVREERMAAEAKGLEAERLAQKEKIESLRGEEELRKIEKVKLIEENKVADKETEELEVKAKNYISGKEDYLKNTKDILEEIILAGREQIGLEQLNLRKEKEKLELIKAKIIEEIEKEKIQKEKERVAYSAFLERAMSLRAKISPIKKQREELDIELQKLISAKNLLESKKEELEKKEKEAEGGERRSVEEERWKLDEVRDELEKRMWQLQDKKDQIEEKFQIVEREHDDLVSLIREREEIKEKKEKINLEKEEIKNQKSFLEKNINRILSGEIPIKKIENPVEEKEFEEPAQKIIPENIILENKNIPKEVPEKNIEKKDGSVINKQMLEFQKEMEKFEKELEVIQKEKEQQKSLNEEINREMDKIKKKEENLKEEEKNISEENNSVINNPSMSVEEEEEEEEEETPRVDLPGEETIDNIQNRINNALADIEKLKEEKKTKNEKLSDLKEKLLTLDKESNVMSKFSEKKQKTEELLLLFRSEEDSARKEKFEKELLNLLREDIDVNRVLEDKEAEEIKNKNKSLFSEIENLKKEVEGLSIRLIEKEKRVEIQPEKIGEIYNKFKEKIKEIKKEKDLSLSGLSAISEEYKKCLEEEKMLEKELEKIEEEGKLAKDTKRLKEISEKRWEINRKRRKIERRRWEVEDHIKKIKLRAGGKDKILEALKDLSNNYEKIKEKDYQNKRDLEEVKKEWEFIEKKIMENAGEIVEEEEEEEEQKQNFSDSSFENVDIDSLLQEKMKKLEEIRGKINAEKEELDKFKKESEVRKEELESKRTEIDGKTRWVLREKERKIQEGKEKDSLRKRENTKSILLEKMGEKPTKEIGTKIKLTEGEVKTMPSIFRDLEKKSKKKSNFIFRLFITVLILGIIFGLVYFVFYFKDKVSLIENQKISNCKTDQGCFEDNFKECKPSKFTPSLDLGEFGGVVTYYYEIIELVDNFCSIKTKFLKNPNPEWVGKEMICKYDNKKDFQTSVQETFNDVKNKCEGPLKEIMIAP